MIEKLTTPIWMKDNPYILNGYRIPGSYRGFYRELFAWHNETLNAWSMIAYGGTALYVWFMYASATLPFFTLLMSALICLPTSVTYHLKCNESMDIRLQSRHLDVTFIGVASVFIAFSLSAYVFPIAVTLFLTGSCMYKTIQFYKNKHETRKDKTLQAVVTFASFYMTPVIIMAIVDPASNLKYFIGLAGSLSIGACCYAFYIPERFLPIGLTDYIGNSHQFMHICLILAHLSGFKFMQHHIKNASHLN